MAQKKLGEMNMLQKHRFTGVLALFAAVMGLGLGTASATQTTQAAAKTGTYAWFAGQNYHGHQVITVNKNRATFSKADLSTKRGAWAKYGNLDRQNRVTTANAMLSKKLMPKRARQALTVNPTGWHNKKIGSGYLFNRSHLIGYQLTGQNNNWKNLMTGTASLNTPGMEHYENQVAVYLRRSTRNYVRYRVEPVFRGRELLARGVHMMAQSVGSNSVRFNVYIFNVQKGVSLNYSTGNSVVSKAAMAKPAKKVVKKTTKKTVKKTVKKVVKKTVKKPAKKTTKKVVRKAAPAYVYVVPNGKVYHLHRTCRTLKRSKHISKITLKAAKARHLRQCKVG